MTHPTKSPPQPAVSVEQCDRDAAADCYEQGHIPDPCCPPKIVARNMRQGKLDNSSYVQAFARHRLSAAPPADGVPAGWQLVPIEPTDAMTWAGQKARYPSANSSTVIYQAMLAAAPKAPTAPIGEADRHAGNRAAFAAGEVAAKNDPTEDIKRVVRLSMENDARLAAQPSPALDPDGYLWKWVERGLFDKETCTPKEALEVMAYHPSAPWMNGRWNVDHKSYAKAFYGKFPKALADRAQGEGEKAL